MKCLGNNNPSEAEFFIRVGDPSVHQLQQRLGSASLRGLGTCGLFTAPHHVTTRPGDPA